MSFSWWLKDVNGKDLLEEFGVHHQMLGLGPNTEGSTHGAYRLDALRARWTDHPYKNELENATRDALESIQRMAQANLESLTPHHCETCRCEPISPTGWDAESIRRLLAIPLQRAYRGGGGW